MEKDEFLIPLNGLTAGKPMVYHWNIGKEFFDGFGNQEVLGASLEVTVSVEKKGLELALELQAEGFLTVACDRCLADLEFPVDMRRGFRIKYGQQNEGCDETEDGVEILYIQKSVQNMDVSQIIYDYACLSLPLQRVHEDGKCDEETINRLGSRDSDISDDEAPEAANPFMALKDMFRN